MITTKKTSNFKKIFIILICIIFLSFFLIHLYFYLFDNRYNSPQNHIGQISSYGDEVKLANITGNGIKDRVVLTPPVKTGFKGITLHKQNLLIYSYNIKKQVWEQEYKTGFLPDYFVEMSIEPNLIAGRDTIIISRKEGSGGFLTYSIIGKHSNYIKILHSNEDSEAIHNGDYKVINNKFVTYRNYIKQDEFCFNDTYGFFYKCKE